jgi:DNA-binding MarR family transcriptional regulator
MFPDSVVTMPEDVDQTALEIAELLPAIAVNLRVGALFDATASDLTANQIVALVLVENAEDARLRAGEIARKMSISAASATALVDRLVEAGMLRRTRGDDRRVVWVALNEDGKELIQRLRAGTVSRIAAVLAGTGPERRESLLQSFRHVATFADQITDVDHVP